MREYESGLFCTVLFGQLRLPAGTGPVRFSFSAGGHPLPVLVRAEGPVESVGEAGTLVGLIDPVAFSDATVVLSPGDVLVLYTDGVTDVPGAAGLDDDELHELVAACCAGSAEAVADAMGGALDARRSYRDRTDDTALIVLRVPEAAG